MDVDVPLEQTSQMVDSTTSLAKPDMEVEENDPKDTDSVICESAVSKPIPEINLLGTSDDDVVSSKVEKRETKTKKKLISSDEESKMRLYRVRKLRVLIDKCRRKKIVFGDRFVGLSYTFSQNPDSLNNAEIESLCLECLEALQTEDESGSSSSNDEILQPVRKKAGIGKGLLAPSKPSLDPTNPYNQAWQSKQHYSYATQGNFPIQGGYGEAAPHMFSPHYHMPVPPIRFGQSTPYSSSSGFYPRQHDHASDVNIEQSYFNAPNFPPQHQSEPEFGGFIANTPIKHTRKAHAVGGAVRHSPSSNLLTPPTQQSSSGPDIYIKEGRRYFAKTLMFHLRYLLLP